MQKCAAVPKNRCEKCIGPVMHEQMPAYTVYIGKTGAFYMKGNQPAACTGAHHRRNDSCISRTEFCRKRGNRITGSLPDGADDRENPV